MKFWNVAIASLVVMGPQLSAAFYSTGHSRQPHRQASQLFADPPPQALTEYLAKAHEDKLKAIQKIEEQKNAEIENLKQELKALKSAPGALATVSSPPPVAAGLDVASMTKEQMAQKLYAYQQFMAKYIVDAQVQKTKAVLAAENAVKQKYEEKLLLLSGTTEITPPPPAATSSTSVAFQERSAKVSAAAAAGKSRWGDLENEKASQAAGAVGVQSAAPVNGAVAPTATTIALSAPPAVPLASIPAFDQRNAMVAAAGQAGKSRWGEPEVAKATQAAVAAGAALPASSTPPAKSASAAASVPSISIPVPPEVEAADHGLRADGGVGGPSLAERVNLGARLLQTSVAAAPVPAPLGSTRAPSTATKSSTYYTQRNAMVVAAAKAGKSRWGELEIQRVASLVGALPSASNAPVKVTPEIAAADHGLRADGGVGGPSLAQRVNFGAALLGQ